MLKVLMFVLVFVELRKLDEVIGDDVGLVDARGEAELSVELAVNDDENDENDENDDENENENREPRTENREPRTENRER